MRPRCCLPALLLACLAAMRPAIAQEDSANLFNAVVVTPADASTPEQKAVQMLVEELAARSLARWKVQQEWPADDVPVVAVGPRGHMDTFAPDFAADLPAEGADKAEGYVLKVLNKRSAPTVLVAGNDSRGILFGCGRLLREMRMTRESVSVSATLDINTAPTTPLRGHQTGFRPKVNTYDAWDVRMWEQYYRDLIVFGTNAIEVMPPRSDDADESPHFPLPKIDMMVEMSQLAKDYGIELWIWYPAMDRDYSDPATVEFARKEWGEVFARLPYITAVFVPGGDPGHTQPKILFDLLALQTENLHKYHPDAQMWMSPQSFGAEWTEEFYALMDAQPAWLTGLAFGPQNYASFPELRKRVPAKYPIRRYPDITHSLDCQYPVPGWDIAYKVTENREVINPRPLHYAHIFRIFDDLSCGFITYSEGVNDDVNKILWSSLGWDAGRDVYDILRDYARYFIGPELENEFAQGLLALEKNWQPPLLSNGSVEPTLEQFAVLLDHASPQVKLQWRFQQAVYRAYYDAYTRRRLLYETELEAQAMDALRQADRLGAALAMDRAKEILNLAVTEPVAQDLRARVFEMAEALYQSVRMQLSVPRYQAIAVRRGANLDLIDYPLNDRPWIMERLDAARGLEGERAQLAALDEVVNWKNPGPGGFYDDLGNVAQQPHLLPGTGWADDPEYRSTPQMAGNGQPFWKLSWLTHAEGRYSAPIQLQYDGLDPGAQYAVKAIYAGDLMRGKIRCVADEQYSVHDYVAKAAPLAPVQYEVPREATADGKLLLTWTQEPGEGGAGRGNQIAEVWLMKKDSN